MDSLTQATLGAAVGVAVMRRRLPVWRAALAGALVGTLPDLDAFIDYGDPVRNVTNHRGVTHSLLYLCLLSPLLAWLAARWAPPAGFRRWWLAIWLILMTHVLLDTMTVYGTQIGQPFTDHPFGLASVFIIDPLYTLPLLVGLALALCGRLRANDIALGLGGVYLLWSLLAQGWVSHKVERQLATTDWPVERVLVTPTPFNTVLWRVLVMTPEHYHEGFYALADGTAPIDFERFDRHMEWYRALGEDWETRRVAWFSKGFFAMSRRADRVQITDLRMGQEPFYSFNFTVAAARRDGDLVDLKPALTVDRPPLAEGLRWIGRRALGERLPPPRHLPGSEYE